MSQITNLLTRVLFVTAFVFAGLAVVEKIANAFGYVTVVGDIWPPERLLELCTTALVFMIALVLRDIKHLLMLKEGK